MNSSLYDRADVVEYTVDKRTIQRSLDQLLKDRELGVMTVNTSNPLNEEEIIKVELYHLAAYKPTEDQVWNVVFVHLDSRLPDSLL